MQEAYHQPLEKRAGRPSYFWPHLDLSLFCGYQSLSKMGSQQGTILAILLVLHGSLALFSEKKMGNRYLVIIQLFILVLLYQGSVSSNQQTFQLHLQQLLSSSSSDCCLHSRQKDCLEKLLRPTKEACKAPSSVTHTSSERKHKPTHNQQFPHRYSCFFAFLMGSFRLL